MTEESAVPRRIGRGRVLIVDDNLGLAENIAEILEGQGYVTEVAASAEEALANLMLRQIGRLITDYRLPGIQGPELVKRLRRLGLDVPALVISAYSDDATIDEARSCGAEFMAKPIDFGALNRFVSQAERR